MFEIEIGRQFVQALLDAAFLSIGFCGIGTVAYLSAILAYSMIRHHDAAEMPDCFEFGLKLTPYVAIALAILPHLIQITIVP